MLRLKLFIYLSVIVLMFIEPVKAQWVQTNGLNDEVIFSLVMNGSTLFAGTQANGIYRSLDNGDNWTDVNNGLTDSVINTLKVISGVIYAGTRYGLFKSSDNGDTWSNTGLPAGNIEDMVAKNDTYYVGTYNGGVYCSYDKGATWTNIGMDTTDVIALVICSSHLFAGSYMDGVFRYVHQE